jgi:metal-dependent amidase/aminoacylase/carboxypeptidase family protein
VLGREAVGTYEGTLAGEDFAEYLQQVPGVMAFIGARNLPLAPIIRSTAATTRWMNPCSRRVLWSCPMGV